MQSLQEKRRGLSQRVPTDNLAARNGGALSRCDVRIPPFITVSSCRLLVLGEVMSSSPKQSGSVRGGKEPPNQGVSFGIKLRVRLRPARPGEIVAKCLALLPVSRQV